MNWASKVELLSLQQTTVMVLVAVGLSLVITCTTAGYPLRWFWAQIFRGPFRKLRNLMLCPHCNSWWTGLVIGGLTTGNIVQALQVAFTTCGLVYTLQRVLSRDTTFAIAHQDDHNPLLGTIRGVSLEPQDEDFDSDGDEEEDDDE